MRKGTLLILSMLLVFSLAGCGKQTSQTEPTVAPSTETTAKPVETTQATVPATASEETTQPAPTEPYVSPIDFASLQAQNPDIYGWLEIPGTKVSFPLVQRADDDSFYLDHNYLGEYEKTGAVFSEATYNGTDMRDYVTFIYAHYQGSEKGFGQVQAIYSDPDSFREHDTIIVYLPGEEFHYKVYAGVTYDNIHAPYHFNHFETERMRNLFIQSVTFAKSNDSNIDDSRLPGYNDRLLVLSTCKSGFFFHKYLVVAVLDPNSSLLSEHTNQFFQEVKK